MEGFLRALQGQILLSLTHLIIIAVLYGFAMLWVRHLYLEGDLDSASRWFSFSNWLAGLAACIVILALLVTAFVRSVNELPRKDVDRSPVYEHMESR